MPGPRPPPRSALAGEPTTPAPSATRRRVSPRDDRNSSALSLVAYTAMRVVPVVNNPTAAPVVRAPARIPNEA